VQRARTAPMAHAPRQTLVRSAIVRLLHQPALASSLQPPYRFAMLRQPGVELLSELIALVRERPEITTGALLEHFGEREESTALQKLAVQSLPGDEAKWIEEFLDTMAQREKQTLQQRVEELQAKQRESGLDESDKEEMRALLQARLA
jgi:DNA primase